MEQGREGACVDQQEIPGKCQADFPSLGFLDASACYGFSSEFRNVFLGTTSRHTTCNTHKSSKFVHLQRSCAFHITYNVVRVSFCECCWCGCFRRCRDPGCRHSWLSATYPRRPHPRLALALIGKWCCSHDARCVRAWRANACACLCASPCAVQAVSAGGRRQGLAARGRRRRRSHCRAALLDGSVLLSTQEEAESKCKLQVHVQMRHSVRIPIVA